MTHAKPGQLPPAHGLYDPAFEHDACGVGFVAHVKGVKSHSIIERGLDVLRNLEHRGATGSDPDTGDGAGILLQIPHDFFVEELQAQNVELPPAGQYGVGMLFLPTVEHERTLYEAAFEKAVQEEGQTVLAWRDVPHDSSRIGELARSVEPVIRQIFIGRNPGLQTEDDFERKLYVIRRSVQNVVASMRMEQEGYFYVSSLSCRTIIYKGLLMTHQMAAYYHDLRDPARCHGDGLGASAVFHQHVSDVGFGPSVSLHRPQRRDQHPARQPQLDERAGKNPASPICSATTLKKLLPLINKLGQRQRGPG